MKRKEKSFRERVKQKIRTGAFVAMSVLSGAAVFRAAEPSVHAQPSDRQQDFTRFTAIVQ